MAKPFVKWVGGKRQLLPALLEHLPLPLSDLSGGARYFEPFTGGGALFFALEEAGLTRAVLNDANPELVNLYRTIQAHPEELADRLEDPIFANDRPAFETVRAWDREGEGLVERSDIDRAARFIYLNRTAFNGLWRVNRKGQFNVPFGRYANPGFPSREAFLEASRALAKAEVREGDFEAACQDAQAGDLVYFDPPYAPVSMTANFVGYTQGGFDDTMQRRLAAVCEALNKKGVAWMLSNSDTPYTREVFGSIPGAVVHTVQAGRSINRDKTGRGKVNEILAVGPAP